ncbi:putative aBC transporter, ATP-binding protein [Mycobacterium xenopi 4042]|uniref:Putative aBC transporter, ATP-binding protein n=1 Tax=Mycobacterium xenopi 4042 TaxID=1299334 RepID=X8E8D4_MYCXE|nr:putative aBC transporter, ATP-binding protein [Mycobacterium xenopi 4042]
MDPVRTAYLSQLLIDINAQIDATILIVTHNINIARTVPDNIGMLFRRKLVMFGAREVLLTSDEPVVRQFLHGRRIGPIGMSEEKDEATMAEEQAQVEAGHHHGGVEEIEGVPPQINPTPGMPERKAVTRHQARVRETLHLLPRKAQEAILDSFEGESSAHAKRAGRVQQRPSVAGEPSMGHPMRARGFSPQPDDLVLFVCGEVAFEPIPLRGIAFRASHARTWVATRSRNHRSWAVTTTHPGNSPIAFSSDSSVSVSKSLVGSSSSSTLPPCLRVRARLSRLRSPPENNRAGFC